MAPTWGYHTTPHQTTPHHITPRNTTPHHAISSHAISRHATLRHAAPYHIRQENNILNDSLIAFRIKHQQVSGEENQDTCFTMDPLLLQRVVDTMSKCNDWRDLFSLESTVASSLVKLATRAGLMDAIEQKQCLLFVIHHLVVEHFTLLAVKWHSDLLMEEAEAEAGEAAAFFNVNSSENSPR